jgi:hypothetical protein
MTCVSTVTQIGRGVVMAGAVAALMLTTNPIPAHAGGSDMGAAIGLGILGGVIAGAAVASSAPPYYGPSPYDYPPQYYYQPAPGYYGPPAPGYYSAPPAYYWPTPYGYPQ